MEPRKFASERAANFLRRFPLRDLDGLGMRSAMPVMPLAVGGISQDAASQGFPAQLCEPPTHLATAAKLQVGICQDAHGSRTVGRRYRIRYRIHGKTSKKYRIRRIPY